MHEDFEYVESLKNEIDELESEKAGFSNIYDLLLEECVFKDVIITKKPKEVPISVSKPKRKTNKTVATPHMKTVASNTTIQKPKSYFKELYENTNKAWKWWIEKKCPLDYKWIQTTPSRPSLKWKAMGRIFSNVRLRSSLVLHQMTSAHNRSELGIHDHNNEPSSSKLVPKVVPLASDKLQSR
ncbi:hypothetical protein Tco_0008404 [Tanacetum coccineum]